MVLRPVVLVAVLLSMAPTVTAGPDDPAECVPPCLWVYPTIDLEVDLTQADLAASNLEELPAVVDVHVRYHWDLQEDGTGVPGPQPSEIHLSLPTIPYWLQAELSADSCPFQPLPHQPDQEVCTVRLHLEPLGIPHNAAALEAGDRLLVVAMSDETGSYKQGFGVEDLRFTWDGAEQDAAPPEDAAPTLHRAVLLPALLVAAAVVAVLLTADRLRRRT